MKNLLAFVAVVIIGFAVVGWYLNWYQIKTTPTENGRHQVTIDFNSPKIKQDLQEGKDRVAKILENASDKSEDSQQVSEAPDFPTFVNPLAQPQNTQQAQKPQVQRQPQTPVEFQITDDGFFIIPNEFFPAEPPRHSPPQPIQPVQYPGR